MAERRMFARSIIDTDAFMDMPLTAQALYFHLGMRADDEGFVSNPKRIQRLVGAAEDDLKLLLVKRFLLAFPSGVVVVKHWKISNYIQKDRFKPTLYQDEKGTLFLKPDNAYTDHPGQDFVPCIQDGYSSDTQVRLGKVSTGKDNPPISPQGDRSESLDVETASGAGTLASPSTTSGSFEEFWEAYPRQINKGKARKEWDALSPDDGLQKQIMDALALARDSEEWAKEDGRYIPSPHNWLKNEGWASTYHPNAHQQSHDIAELEELSFFSLPGNL